MKRLWMISLLFIGCASVEKPIERINGHIPTRHIKYNQLGQCKGEDCAELNKLCFIDELAQYADKADSSPDYKKTSCRVNLYCDNTTQVNKLYGNCKHLKDIDPELDVDYGN